MPDHGQGTVRPRAEIGARLVQEAPAPADRGATRPPCPDDPGTLRILRSDGERQTTGVVPLPGHSNLAEVALSPQPPSAYELGPDECTAQAIPLAFSTDRASMARSLQRICQVRNRVREFRSLGSVRGGAQQCPRLLGHRNAFPRTLEFKKICMRFAYGRLKTNIKWINRYWICFYTSIAYKSLQSVGR